MQIRTYTHIWKAPKVFHTFMDWNLPVPIPLNTAAIFIAVAIVWIPTIFAIFNPSLTSPISIVFLLGVPYAAARFGSKPIFEEKSLFAYLYSQVKYLLEPKTWSDLTPDHKPETEQYVVKPKIWNPRWRKNS
jgi:TcpE family